MIVPTRPFQCDFFQQDQGWQRFHHFFHGPKSIPLALQKQSKSGYAEKGV
jgi:hypothetical protein